MKCVICKSAEIELKNIEEEIKTGRDIVLLPMEALVCMNCGEIYYDRKNMKKINEIKSKLAKQSIQLEVVGKVLLVHST